MKNRLSHTQSIEKFDALIRRHAELCQSSELEENTSFRLQKLIREFSGLLNKCLETEVKQACDHLGTFHICLNGYQESRASWAKAQETKADEFNLFQVMDVVRHENIHSNLLAWLLDHRIERGTHAQGNLGLRLFLETLREELKLPGPLDLYTESNYWVRREIAGEESRMDIEVAARGAFIIHIENKIGAAEGMKQTSREWGDLLRRSEALGIPKENVRGLFLTPNGRNPSDANFISVSWNKIATVFDRFEEEAKPLIVKMFAAHYAKALRTLVVTKLETSEEEDAAQTI